MSNPLDRVTEAARAVTSLGLPMNIKLTTLSPYEFSVLVDFWGVCYDAREDLQYITLYEFSEYDLEKAREEAYEEGRSAGYEDGWEDGFDEAKEQYAND